MTTKRRKRHSPEQIVRKLRDADAMLNAGKDLAAVLQSLEVSEVSRPCCEKLVVMLPNPRSSAGLLDQIRSSCA